METLLAVNVTKDLTYEQVVELANQSFEPPADATHLKKMLSISQNEKETLKEWYDRVKQVYMDLVRLECNRSSSNDLNSANSLATNIFIEKLYNPRLKELLGSQHYQPTNFEQVFDWAQRSENFTKVTDAQNNNPILCGYVKAIAQQFQQNLPPHPQQNPAPQAEPTPTTCKRSDEPTQTQPEATLEKEIRVARVQPQPENSETNQLSEISAALSKLLALNEASAQNNNRKDNHADNYNRENYNHYYDYPNYNHYYDYGHGYGYNTYDDYNGYYNSGRYNGTNTNY